MIRNDAEYKEILRRIAEDAEFSAAQRAALEAEGYTNDDVEYAMGPILSFHAQLIDEKEWYERVKRGEIGPVTALTQIGRLLIAARIALGVSQAELARRLNVSEAQVSRDERNEYHCVSTEKAQKVFEALHVKPVTQISLPQNSDERELALA